MTASDDSFIGRWSKAIREMPFRDQRAAERDAQPAPPAIVPMAYMPDLPNWSKADDLGGLMPSDIRGELRAYAIRAVENYRRLAAGQQCRAEGVVVDERVRVAGAMLANCAFNLAQRDHLSDDERRSLDESRKVWDAALRGEGTSILAEGLASGEIGADPGIEVGGTRHGRGEGKGEP